jgi:hypothetical protein
VRAAARLQVDAVDFHHAHTAVPARRLHAHAAHQLRIGVELGLADPAVAHRMAFADQPRQALRQRLLVEGLGHEEVEPRVVGGDRASVDRVRHQRAQQMRHGVKAHVAVPPLPVDLGGHLGADRQRRQIGIGGAQMRDLARLRALARVDDAHFDTAVGAQHTGVTCLSTAERVEHRAVELHGVAFDGDHARTALAQRRILAEEFLGHHCPRVGFTATNAAPRRHAASQRLPTAPPPVSALQRAL